MSCYCGGQAVAEELYCPNCRKELLRKLADEGYLTRIPRDSRHRRQSYGEGSGLWDNVVREIEEGWREYELAERERDVA